VRAFRRCAPPSDRPGHCPSEPITWHQFPGIYAQNKIKQLDFSAKYQSSVDMGISVLKAIQIVRNSNTFRVFKTFNFIMLKMISRGYEDFE
jgi:hypothetical protein